MLRTTAGRLSERLVEEKPLRVGDLQLATDRSRVLRRRNEKFLSSHEFLLPRTVVRRILLTLCELGYAAESDVRGFRLTPKILTLGMTYLTSLPFWGHAQRALETMWMDVKESCVMSVFDGHLLFARYQ